MIVAYSPNAYGPVQRSKRGIVYNHTYVIIGAFETKINGVEEKLLQLANPWSAFDHYSGRLSDQKLI